jgi:DNA replication protein DnaC
MSAPSDPPRGHTESVTYQRLREHLAFLQLGAAAEALTSVLDQAHADRLSLTAALERLLAIETEAVEARRLTGRLRFACLPAPWALSDFDFTAQPGVDETLIRELASLRFLDDAGNVLFIGPPGTGKTMLAIGLARAAVHAGHRVYFTTADELAKRCRKAALEGRWATTMRFYCGPRLLVIDEFRRAASGWRARLGQVVGDADLAAGPVEHGLPTTGVEPSRELFAIARQQLVRDAVAAKRCNQSQAHRTAGRPGHDRADHAVAGVVVHAGDHLGGQAGDEVAAVDDIELHSCIGSGHCQRV